MAETDLSTWLTVEQAALAIGVSTRTVERLGRAGKLDQRLRPQAGSPPVAVYFPDDVDRERLARHRAPAPFVLEREQDVSPANGNGHRQSLKETPGSFPETLAIVPAADDPIRQFFALLIRMAQSPPSPPMAASGGGETLWVTVKEAAAILGFPQADVRRLIHDGDLDHRTTGRGGIRIRRKDLEAL